MIHDISPKHLHNEYTGKAISKGSVVFSFRDDKVLCSSDDETRFPRYEDMECADHEYIYLFEVDGVDFFLDKSKDIKIPSGFAYTGTNIFRAMQPRYLAYAGITAYHLSNWYRDNEFCGRCGNVMEHDTKERAMSCKKCKNLVYPKICPVVIVGVISGTKLLMTKSVNREYTRYALIAGFIEIGEDAEGAVRREVMEETGVKVKNITYYKSQPWGFSGSLLFGYYAQLDGEPNLRIQESELSEAAWIERDEITTVADHFSLTNEMICRFKDQM